MTPIEEQQAMQEYVRRQLMARQGPLNLTPGQQPLGPQDQAPFMQRPPLSGVGPPQTPGPPQLPGLEMQGGYAPQMGRAGQPEPFNAQLMYRKSVPF